MDFSKYFIIIFLLPNYLLAQGGLFISSGAEIVCNGNPQIVVNDGKFVNDGDFTASSSTFFFKGSAATENSTIYGANITTFNNLTISKSSNDVRLDFDIQVDGDLQMDGGLLILNYSDIELGGDILGETESTRITGTEGGTIIKTVDLNMPLAQNPGNIGAEITSMANMGSTIIRRRHIQLVNGSLKSIYRHYEIIPSNNINLDATLRFNYFDAELDGKDENNLDIWQFNNSIWTSLGWESNDDNENWVETSGIPFFDLVTLSEDMGPPLPIELLDFKAIANQDNQVDLYWATATEINNDYFTIERSKDGIQFEAIEEVEGAGTIFQSRSYHTIDKNPFLGTSYYRLKQTDFDGTFSYSEIRVVHIELNEQSHFAVYPNPMKDVLYIANNGKIKGKTTIEIFDAVGHLKYIEKLEMDDQLNTIVINEVSKLIAGKYYLVIQTPQEVYNFGLVKIGDE